MTQLPTPKAVLFDWDNTLVNTWPTIHRALNHCLREMGHEEWSLEKVKGNVKKSMRDAFPAMFGEQWEDAAQIYQTYYRQIHLEKLEALEGAMSLLDWLAAQHPVPPHLTHEIDQADVREDAIEAARAERREAVNALRREFRARPEKARRDFGTARDYRDQDRER